MATTKANTNLDEDRDTLLEIRDTLAGDGPLNWSTKVPIDCWDGVTVSNSRVAKLALRKLKLTGTIPVLIGNLTGLKTLDLGNNGLKGNIPASLGSLSNLRELYLSHNKLTGMLPIELGGLTRLETLDLIRNQLTGRIPPTLSNLKKLNPAVPQPQQTDG